MDRRALSRFRRNKGAVAGLAIVTSIALFAIAFPLLSSHSPFEPDFVNGRQPFGVPAGPSRLHPLGTDTIFRDLLVRLAYGGRLSLEVALVATAIAMVLGTGIGVVSGYFKGTRVRVDAVLDAAGASLLSVAAIGWLLHASTASARFGGGAAWMFGLALLLRAPLAVRRRPSARDVLDVVGAIALVYSIVRWRADIFADRRVLGAVVAVGLVSSLLALRDPRDDASRHLRIDLDDAAMRVVDVLLAFPFLLLLMALSAAVDRTTETTIFLVLGLTGWTGTARVIRGKTLQIRELEFVTASRALGQSTPRMIVRHILPNVIGVSIVLATNSVAGMIVAEAALSFLGLSVPPPTASWGRMLDEGRPYASLAPWLLVGPAVAILLAVLGFNLLGDGLRDAFDPKDA
jgi:ABC-type dipeptide/oligopeptide/nickel transport system permease subunit